MAIVEPSCIRIQFELTPDLITRLQRYEPSLKLRHAIGRQALEEWLNRREGRDKKYQLEQLIADEKRLLPVIQHLIDENKLNLQ